MSEVVVVIGPGQIGQAIARRVGAGKHLLLADMRPDNAKSAAVTLENAGFQVSVAAVDASSRAAVRALGQTATGLGDVVGLIHAAGVSPSQASPATILPRRSTPSRFSTGAARKSAPGPMGKFTSTIIDLRDTSSFPPVELSRFSRRRSQQSCERMTWA